MSSHSRRTFLDDLWRMDFSPKLKLGKKKKNKEKKNRNKEKYHLPVVGSPTPSNG